MREIIYAIKDWLVHLFDVHCSECRHEKLEDELCNNCEYLKQQLEIERHERQKLFEYIISPPIALPEKEIEEEIEPITPKHIPWHIKREMLEQKDREKFRQIKLAKEVKKQSTEELEQELEIKEN